MASPFIIGPPAMLGFLDIGGSDKGQAIHRRTDYSDFAGSKKRPDGGGCGPQDPVQMSFGALISAYSP